MTNEAGFDLPPFRHAERLTEQRNQRTLGIDQAGVSEALAMIQSEDRRCFEAAEAAAPQVARAIEYVVDAFRSGGRLIYVGAGTSGRLGVLDASEQPPTFGVPPELVVGIIAGGPDALVRSIEGAEDRAREGILAMDQAKVGHKDAVLGITTGGRAQFVLAALARAKIVRARTILLTCTPALPGEEALADCQIRALVGPEVIAGSTRMKAGTVTKLILNQITTVAMIQIGKVYENLMVDLKPSNAKLRDRAIRILMELAPLDYDGARSHLMRADNDLKVAIVMALARSTKETAQRALEENEGHVSRTIRRLRESRR